jgi:hypothetical protein
MFFQTQKAHYKEDQKKKIPKSKLSFQKLHNPWKYNSFNEARQ